MKSVMPVTRTKEEAKASYDKMSRWYDLLAGVSEKNTGSGYILTDRTSFWTWFKIEKIIFRGCFSNSLYAIYHENSNKIF